MTKRALSILVACFALALLAISPASPPSSGGGGYVVGGVLTEEGVAKLMDATDLAYYPPDMADFYLSTGPLLEDTIAGTPTKTAVSSGAAMTAGLYEGLMLCMKDGPAAGECATINTNTTGQFTLQAPGFNIVPATGNTFQVCTGYLICGDDVNGDGSREKPWRSLEEVERRLVHTGKWILNLDHDLWSGASPFDWVEGHRRTGTADATSTLSTVVDLGQAWNSNEWVGYEVVVDNPKASLATPHFSAITGNTATTLTLTTPLGGPTEPDGLQYRIHHNTSGLGNFNGLLTGGNGVGCGQIGDVSEGELCTVIKALRPGDQDRRPVFDCTGEAIQDGKGAFMYMGHSDRGWTAHVGYDVQNCPSIPHEQGDIWRSNPGRFILVDIRGRGLIGSSNQYYTSHNATRTNQANLICLNCDFDIGDNCADFASQCIASNDPWITCTGPSAIRCSNEHVRNADVMTEMMILGRDEWRFDDSTDAAPGWHIQPGGAKYLVTNGHTFTFGPNAVGLTGNSSGMISLGRSTSYAAIARVSKPDVTLFTGTAEAGSTATTLVDSAKNFGATNVRKGDWLLIDEGGSEQSCRIIANTTTVLTMESGCTFSPEPDGLTYSVYGIDGLEAPNETFTHSGTNCTGAVACTSQALALNYDGANWEYIFAPLTLWPPGGVPAISSTATGGTSGVTFTFLEVPDLASKADVGTWTSFFNSPLDDYEHVFIGNTSFQNDATMAVGHLGVNAIVPPGNGNAWIAMQPTKLRLHKVAATGLDYLVGQYLFGGVWGIQGLEVDATCINVDNELTDTNADTRKGFIAFSNSYPLSGGLFASDAIPWSNARAILFKRVTGLFDDDGTDEYLFRGTTDGDSKTVANVRADPEKAALLADAGAFFGDADGTTNSTLGDNSADCNTIGTGSCIRSKPVACKNAQLCDNNNVAFPALTAACQVDALFDVPPHQVAITKHLIGERFSKMNVGGKGTAHGRR